MYALFNYWNLDTIIDIFTQQRGVTPVSFFIFLFLSFFFFYRFSQLVSNHLIFFPCVETPTPDVYVLHR